MSRNKKKEMREKKWIAKGDWGVSAGFGLSFSDTTGCVRGR